MTRYISFEASPEGPCHPTSPPIYQTSTFEQLSAGLHGNYDYTRSGNPTRTLLESQLSVFEGGEYSLAYTSGMAAISALLRRLNPFDEVLAGHDLYGGTHRLLGELEKRGGLIAKYFDPGRLGQIGEILSDRTRLVLVETPSNPMLKVADLRELSQSLSTRDCLLAVDNTMLSPHLQNPLELGADVVLHSATKHLCGHSDVTAGSITTNRRDIYEDLGHMRNAEGTALSPFDSWLLLRGMKTLGVRMDRQQSSAEILANRLIEHPEVTRVYFLGFNSHAGRDIHFQQARGPGCVLSFETRGGEQSRQVVESTRHFTTTVSFGGVRSSISVPWIMSHASVPEPLKESHELTDSLIRVSVGLEDPEDLWSDLEEALDRLGE